MNILFIVPSYKPAFIYGGPIVVIAQLAETLVTMGHSVTVYTTTANGATELMVSTGEETIVDGVKVYYFKRVTGDHTHASPALWRQLDRNVVTFDVVHIHSWWNILTIGAAWVCRKHGIKPVISPHGMLSKYILSTNNSRKKKWLHRLVGKRLLAKSILHVSTEMEWEESREIIPNWQGKVIPNLVALPKYKHRRVHNEVFTIGFLSRVDPKKGLDVLIRALGQVQTPYQLLVAGAGSEDYTKELHALTESTGNADKVKWLGWKNGEEKFVFFSQLDLFALTSYSENFAIVVIEALSTGTPVLVSENVGLYKFVVENDYGWVTTMKQEDIVRALNDAIRDKNKIQVVNNLAPAAINKEYEDCYLAQQYLDLYKAPVHQLT